MTEQQITKILTSACFVPAEYTTNANGGIVEILRPGFLVDDMGRDFEIIHLVELQDNLQAGLQEKSAMLKGYAKALTATGLIVMANADAISVHKNQEVR